MVVFDHSSFNFSIIHHVQNQHKWMVSYSEAGITRCKHGPLTDEREKEWMEGGSPPHVALTDIVMNKLLQKDTILSKLQVIFMCHIS